jgi:DNA ligase-4
MEALIASLEPNFVKNEIPGVKYKGRKRPDLFIDPANSVIVQVKASEILYSKEYAINYSLRFPRIIAVRRDKLWNEATTVKEFHDLRIALKGKLVQRSDTFQRPDDNDPGPSSSSALVPANPNPNAKPNNYFDNIQDGFNFSSSDDETEDSRDSKSRKTTFTTATKSPLKGILLKAKNALEESKIPNPGKVEQNVFKGRVFCVSANFDWKMSMEARIKSYGGDIVRNTTDDTFGIVAESGTTIPVRNKMKEGLYDIVKPAWIEKCIEARTFVPFLPKDLFFAKRSTQEAFSPVFDIYGDPYAQKLSLDEVRELIRAMIQAEGPQDQVPPTEALKREVNNEIFNGDQTKMLKYSFFSDCKVAFRGEPDFLLVTGVEFYGGTVAEDEAEPGVTHIILPKGASSPRRAGLIRNHSAAFLMKTKWVEDCLERKECLDEFSYIVG